METGTTIRKVILAIVAAAILHGCDLHAHALGGNHRLVHNHRHVYAKVCDDPELDPYSFSPLYCEEHYDGICCVWVIEDHHYETFCLWDDSCAWERYDSEVH